MRQNPEGRFWPKVDQSGECWLWVGAKWQNGYGMFLLNGKQVGAHRVSYEWANGPIPAGLQIDHLCRNHACVRPVHLEAVTPMENTRRGITAEVARARHAARTYFPCGCPLEGNTRTNRRGVRSCIRCTRAYHREYARSHYAAHPKVAASVCKQGHQLAVDGATRMTKQGVRECIECSRTRSREYMRRKRAGQIATDFTVTT